MDDCIAQCHEAQKERAKKSYDLIIVLCRHVDALVNKTLDELDECGGDQAVSRVVADWQACMKPTTGLLPASGSHTPPEQEKTPANKEPSQSLRRKPTQKATYSPPEKHAAPKTYAELQGHDTRNAPEEAGPAPPKQKTLQDKQSLCQTPRSRSPALHHQDGKQRFAEREGGGDRLLCLDSRDGGTVPVARQWHRAWHRAGLALPYIVSAAHWHAKWHAGAISCQGHATGVPPQNSLVPPSLLDRDSINAQDRNYDGRLATVQGKDRKGPQEVEESRQMIDGDVVIEQDVLPEVAGAFGVSPETAYWANTVVLMGARLKVEYPVSRGVRPCQCRRCWGLHRTEGCKDAPRCRLCGDPSHRTAEHHSSGSTIKCANCNGQHAADSPSCPMTAPAAQKDRRKQKHALKEDSKTHRSTTWPVFVAIVAIVAFLFAAARTERVLGKDPVGVCKDRNWQRLTHPPGQRLEAGDVAKAEAEAVRGRIEDNEESEEELTSDVETF
ncbi:hypothetical protein V8E54_008891 [Elaphomyces granulatus]